MGFAGRQRGAPPVRRSPSVSRMAVKALAACSNLAHRWYYFLSPHIDTFREQSVVYGRRFFGKGDDLRDLVDDLSRRGRLVRVELDLQ